MDLFLIIISISIMFVGIRRRRHLLTSTLVECLQVRISIDWNTRSTLIFSKRVSHYRNRIHG